MASADQTEIMRVPMPMQFQGIRIRFVALLIDTIILSLLIGVVGSIFRSQTAGWAFGLFSFLIFLTYFTYLEGSTGQTVGKMLMKIKVIRADGGKVDMKQAFTRNILRVIDGLLVYLIGAILLWKSDKKQRLGDSIAQTVVVKA
jgi:uncharacterized RDD family membrane protein YckC